MKINFCPGFPNFIGVMMLVCAMFFGFVFHSSASLSMPDSIAFRIMQDGDKLGRHIVTFRRINGDLHVDIAIDIEVKILFIPVYSYRHRNHEVWRGGRLISLKSETDDNGESHWVNVEADDSSLKVDSFSGSFEAPLDTMPTSYWSQKSISKSVLLDTQHGKLVNVSIAQSVDDVLDTPLGTVATKRFDVTGDLKLSLWYSESGAWAKTAFQMGGIKIEYFLDPKLLRAADQRTD
mgnify:CR=1 FL=1